MLNASCLKTKQGKIVSKTKQFKSYTKLKGKTNTAKQKPAQVASVRRFLMNTEQTKSLIDPAELPIMSSSTNASQNAQQPANEQKAKDPRAGSAPGATLNTDESGYRLRRNSYRQSIVSSAEVQAPQIPDTISEEDTTVKSLESNTDKDVDEMGSIENLLPPKVLLRREDFEKKTNPNKMEAVFDAINRLHSMHLQTSAKIKDLEYAVFDEDSGVLPQLKAVAEHAKGSDDQMKIVTAELIELREELEISKRIIHKQSKQIETLKNKQADLTARSMADNITITGIKSDSPKQTTTECIALLLNFFEEELEFKLEEDEAISVAHRIGQYTKNSHRPIVFQCPQPIRKKNFDNTRKLAGKAFSVNQQLPDSLAENRREIRQMIKTRQRQEAGMEEESKSTIKVRNNKLYINGQCQKKKLVPPSPLQMFPSLDERNKMRELDIKYSKPKSVKSCEFKAAACTVTSMNEVHLAYKRIYREFPQVDHIVAAFSLNMETGYNDDAEHGAGYRVLDAIIGSRMSNIVVFIIRFYGGEHLGPARFTTIKELAEDIIAKTT